MPRRSRLIAAWLSCRCRGRSSRSAVSHHRAVHAVAAVCPAPASYLGVFENGAPPAYQPVDQLSPRRPGPGPTWWATTAAGPQPFDASFAQDAAPPRRHPVRADRPQLRLGRRRSPPGAYDTYLRSYADSVRDFGHAVIIGFGHEMNAPWYSWGYRARPAADVRRRLAAHRHAVPRPGRRQRHLAVDHQRRPPRAPGRSPPGGRAPATSPGSASTATTTGPPTPSPASSGRTIRQVRTLHRASRSCCPRPPSGPRPGQFAQDQRPVPRHAASTEALGLVWFDKDPARRRSTIRTGGSRTTRGRGGLPARRGRPAARAGRQPRLSGPGGASGGVPRPGPPPTAAPATESSQSRGSVEPAARQRDGLADRVPQCAIVAGAR